MKKFLALVLSLCMVFSLAAVASAAEIDADGGSGSTPVYLSSTADGQHRRRSRAHCHVCHHPHRVADGNVAERRCDHRRQLPDRQPFLRRGSCPQREHFRRGTGWKLTAFGDKSSLAHEKVDSDKLGFALSIGGGAQVQTDASDAASQALLTAPMTGCYLSGVGDASGNAVDVAYAAIVTPLSQAVTNATVANVVFVVEWDT